MTTITKEQLLQCIGDFTWFWGCDFFIVTKIGNFHWRDPYHDGDNIMTPFDGDIMDFCKFQNVDYGRDEGSHDIRRYCGTEFTLVVPVPTNHERNIS